MTGQGTTFPTTLTVTLPQTLYWTTISGYNLTLYEVGFEVGGASGDNSSINNKGVEAEIRTHIYSVQDQDHDSFWVGSTLDNGAFIQFGYTILNPNCYYCSKGRYNGTNLICTTGFLFLGNSSSDARWFWWYWPSGVSTLDGSEFVIGPPNSVGTNGTWHAYSIMPNGNNQWNFLLDGQRVDSADFEVTKSKAPPLMVAEKSFNNYSQSPQLDILGPVEFRNLSYLEEDGWHNVTSLNAISTCLATLYPNCGVDIPYGVSVVGPNDIVAGTGMQRRQNGESLWSLINAPTGAVPEFSSAASMCIVVMFALISVSLSAGHSRRLIANRKRRTGFGPS
jgi:hypothetical protein